MKSYISFGLCILSIFILCSLSFQSVLANEKTETNQILNDIKNYDIKKYNIKNNHEMLVKLKFQSDLNCDCNINNNYPLLICSIIRTMWNILSILLFFVITPLELFIIQRIVYLTIVGLENLNEGLGCPPI